MRPRAGTASCAPLPAPGACHVADADRGQDSSVSDLAARRSAPPSTLHREVVLLDGADLITSRTQGRNRLVRANTGYPPTPALTRLLRVTSGPRVVIGEEFAIDGPPPHDIDVLVVGSVDRADVYGAADRAGGRLGVEANPVARTPKQWGDPAGPLVAQIQASTHRRVRRARPPLGCRELPGWPGRAGATARLISVSYRSGAVFRPTTGKLSDLCGPRRIFLTGVGILLAGGVVGVTAPTFGVLLVSRAPVGPGSAATGAGFHTLAWGQVGIGMIVLTRTVLDRSIPCVAR